MKKILFLLLLVIANICHAQTDSSAVIIYMQSQSAYKSIPIKDQQLMLDDLPAQIDIIFPDNDFMNYELLLNQDSDRVTISFNCGSIHCQQIYLSDMENSRLHLVFYKNTLIQIGRRPVHIDIKDEIPFIALNNKGKKVIKQEKAATPTGTIDTIVTDVTVNPVDKEYEQTTYDSLAVSITAVGTNREKFYKEKGNIAACDEIQSLFNQVFLKPCPETNAINSAATTIKYRVVIDDRDHIDKNRNRVTFLKLKNRGSYEYYRVKKHISPQAFSEMEIDVVGHKDSSYNIVLDDGRNYFLEGQQDFQRALANVSTQVFTTADSTNTPKDSNSTSTGTQIDKKTLEEKVKEIPDADLSAATTALPVNLKNDTVALFAKAFLNDTVQRKIEGDVFMKAISAIAPEKFEYIRNKTSYSKRDTIEFIANAYLQGDTSTQKEIRKQLTAYVWTNDAVLGKQETQILLGQLLSLSEALKQFNYEYYDKDYRINEWAKDITALKQEITNTFFIPVTKNADDLAIQLYKMVRNRGLNKQYYNQFRDIIKTIQSQYQTACKVDSKTRIFSKQLPVPNADAFKATVNYANRSATNLFKREFWVSSGFQIDFSTGLFINGFNNAAFSLIPTTFRYKETRDTIGTSNNDSLIYTGRIRDTTGNMIYRKNSRLTYGTGFLIHAYTRTGNFYNAGLAAGFMFDNAAHFDILLGGSLMLSTGSTRISITGGVCWGKQDDLSEYAKNYEHTANTNNSSYSSIHSVPGFYKFQSPEIVSSWNTSWFLGITFNFTSVTPGKNK